MRTTTLFCFLLAVFAACLTLTSGDTSDTRQPKLFFKKAWHPREFGKIHVVRKNKGWESPRGKSHHKGHGHHHHKGHKGHHKGHKGHHKGHGHNGWGWGGWGGESNEKASGWTSWMFPRKSFGLHVKGGVGFSFGGDKKKETHHHKKHNNHGWGGWGWKEMNKHTGWGWDDNYDDDVDDDYEDDEPEEDTKSKKNMKVVIRKTPPRILSYYEDEGRFQALYEDGTVREGELRSDIPDMGRILPFEGEGESKEEPKLPFYNDMSHDMTQRQILPFYEQDSSELSEFVSYYEQPRQRIFPFYQQERSWGRNSPYEDPFYYKEENQGRNLPFYEDEFFIY